MTPAEAHGLPRYPAYKPAGAPWLGDVPEHWRVLPNRALFAEARDRHGADEQMLSVTITRGVIPQSSLLEGSSKKDSSREDKSAYKVVRPNDIVYNKMRAWQGAIGISDFRGIVSPAYVVVRLRGNDQARYFHHAFRTPQFAKEAERWSYGITSDMWSLRPEHFRTILAPLPPLPEQQAIVRYLDYHDRLIRRYLRAKQREIALLQEQKQAIIHRAVTRGLNPDTPMKPSGVEWLGDIPAHWEVRRLKTVFDCLNSVRVPLSSVERGQMVTRQYDYYGASGVIDRVDGYLFDGEFLLLAEDGANLVLRNLPLVLIARGRFWVNNHAHILRAREGSIEYYAGLLEGISFMPWISGAAQPKLTKDRLMAISIVVPPHDEQHRITEHVRTETEALSAAISAAQRQEGLLREYRTRLIADVVTGQVDVRAAAAALPQEAETHEDVEPELANGIGEDESFETGEDNEEVVQNAAE